MTFFFILVFDCNMHAILLLHSHNEGARNLKVGVCLYSNVKNAVQH